jgi:predicted permease
MRALRDDVRFAVRRLRQQPGFTVVAVLTLALGLGANIAIFTLLHAVMLRSLPVTRPGELYRLGDTLNCCVNSGLQTSYSLYSYPLYSQLRDELKEFQDLAAFQATAPVTALRPPNGLSVSVPASYVSANYFRVLGVGSAAGRVFAPGDDVAGAAPVMVMSHRTWVEQFAGDDTLIGQPFMINGVAVTLVGIAAPGFFGETIRPNPAGFWLPLGQEPVIRGAETSLLGRPAQDWLYAIGRLPPGANVDAASQHATRVLQTWLAAQTFLTDRNRERLPQQQIVVTSAAGGVQQMRGNFGQSLTLLFAMSALVLLIAAANLANLLLARADRAQAAVRAALGASSSRLVRQSITEGLVLALAGCAGAFLVSMFATRSIIGLAFPPDTIMPVDVVPSPAIVLFSVALALVTGGLFAAAPAWAMARTNPIDALRGLSREGADRSFVPRRSLVVVQVTLSIVLLAGAGLLTKSLSRLENQPMGFDVDRRLIVRVDPPTTLAADLARLDQVLTSMRQRLEQVPGIEMASYALYSPMEGNNWSGPIAISGRPIDEENRDISSWNRVGPNYFETLGTRVIRGRGILLSDTATSQRVAVVNSAFVQRFLDGRDPLGVQLGNGDASHSNDFQIVGVVEDVKYSNASRPTLPMIFFPVMQTAPYTSPSELQTQTRSMLVRAVALKVRPGATNLEPAIRRALADAHPEMAVTRILPLDVQVAGNFRNNRLLATLAGSYGVLALLLAALGLYGVTAYGVSRRVHEIGVRMALGADRRDIVWSVLRSAVLQTLVGLAMGVPAALAASRWVGAYLFEVGARDPIVIGAAAGVLILTAVLAAVLPARRAASVNPTQALRAQ